MWRFEGSARQENVARSCGMRVENLGREGSDDGREERRRWDAVA